MALELWRTRPYTTSSSLSRTLDRLFDEAFSLPRVVTNTQDGTGTHPLPVNIWETPEGFHAIFLAPGLDEASLNVSVHEDMLTVEGEQHFQMPESGRSVWQEFGPSRFRRSLRLGAAVDPAKVEALYRNGMLLVTLPKAESARPRQIPVNVAASGSASEAEAKES